MILRHFPSCIEESLVIGKHNSLLRTLMQHLDRICHDRLGGTGLEFYFGE